MHLKVFVKLKKTLKTFSSGQKTPPKKKNPTNPKKPKKPKKNHWAGFLKKKRVFSNPDLFGSTFPDMSYGVCTKVVGKVQSFFLMDFLSLCRLHEPNPHYFFRVKIQIRILRMLLSW